MERTVVGSNPRGRGPSFAATILTICCSGGRSAMATAHARAAAANRQYLATDNGAVHEASPAGPMTGAGSPFWRPFAGDAVRWRT